MPGHKHSIEAETSSTAAVLATSLSVAVLDAGGRGIVARFSGQVQKQRLSAILVGRTRGAQDTLDDFLTAAGEIDGDERWRCRSASE